MPGGLAHPFEPIHEIGVVELVGVDEQVDQNEYGASVAVALAGPLSSGEILHVTLLARETGSGSVPAPNGVLYVFDADPVIAAGDTAMTAAARLTVIAQIEVETTDWKSDANGASASIFTKPVAFHPVSSLYFAWFQEHATSINDAAGDNEVLELNAWYRKDS